ncbi:MAG: methionine--tRNA ligase [Candidatus Omnitrophica bacterium]|nr:methionine--tRNA ligase [Candidatus Omnitrophota bacterium]
MGKFYLTTPIYYVNASPHIGHAYTNIISDCLGRFKRIKGDEVFFLTGTDEHGEKIKKAALADNTDVLDFVNNVSDNFKNLWEKLNISYDCFIRTTDSAHKEAVKQVIIKLNENGDIYKAKYSAFYCMPCESFWTDTQTKDANGKCPLCSREVEKVEEENYFFKLSKYEDWLKQYLKDNPDCVRPKTRYNEVNGFLDNNKLADLCISRPKARVSWGVEFPLDCEYVVYVWFDALLNYLSGIGFGVDQEKVDKWWPADVHLMAKDILRHHAIFWPIMVHALGLAPGKIVFAHGWWKIGDEKISKSLGNIVNPLDVIKEIGVDALRYFLLREIPLGADGNYSSEAIITRINSDLANDVGNLVYRTLNMAEKYFQGDVSCDDCLLPVEFKQSLQALSVRYINLMDDLSFSKALELIFSFIGVMNKYIEDTKPWALHKENNLSRLKVFLCELLEGIRIVSLYLYPFMPQTSEAINKQLGIDLIFSLDNIQWRAKAGFSTKKGKPLFPRIDVS